MDMLPIWNGRIQAAMADGAAADFTFNQQLLDFDCMVIPKGAPNKDEAMQLLSKIVTADYQARLPQYINYGPINAAAYESDLITPEMAKGLPSSPDNAAQAAYNNAAWWRDNLDEVTERFELFIQQ
ncbi:putative spermidine/putrescine transport system substrate-binding protein [Ruegeria halocynthiae]|uniref:Putative spermidine/putrescine transport system substrate-binding protein n=1 Tax=Ruegeria halocynthiae TaxID=985054 RepID=A0A1H2YHK3_9RHOB|nr:putative spermidine/putrescine transport system substrate-binding protein [Ruegeria halocynthiae]